MGDGYYVIGVDGDQGAYWASLGETEKANATITSMQKNVNNGFLRAAELHLNGKCPYGENEKLGLAVGGGLRASPRNCVGALRRICLPNCAVLL